MVPAGRADLLPHRHRAIHSRHAPAPETDFDYQLNLLIAGLEHTANG